MIFHPVGVAEIALTLAPAFSYAIGATVEAAPFAQSTITFKPISLVEIVESK